MTLLRSLRRALVVAQPFIVATAFVLLGLLLRSQWSELRSYPWNIRPLWLVASGACIVTGWLVEIRMWRRLLRLVGGHLDYRSAVTIWFSSAIARYVPGKIWQPLSLTSRCSERGIRPEAALASLSLFQVIHMLGAGVILAVYLATWGRTGVLAVWAGEASRWWSAIVAAPVIAFVVFFVARPGALIALANIALRRMGREPLSSGLTTTELLILLTISIVSSLLASAGFTLLAGAMLPSLAPLRSAVPHLAAAYQMAFAVGLLSLLTPSGLVVREGVLFLLLSPLVGGAPALVISLGMRVWEVSLDATVAAAALGLPKLLQD